MAGSRASGDPLATATGVAHKALAPIAGVPMLARVVETLRAAAPVGRIVVCGFNAALIDVTPRLATVLRAQELEFDRGGDTPGASALHAVRELSLAPPVLVTTADHPLLSAATVDEFCARSAACDADVSFGLAPAAAVAELFPGIRRTRFRFRDGEYCGCNLYGLLSTAGLGAPAEWVRVERHRKRPWRLVSALGVGVLLRFWLGRLALADVSALAQAQFGLRARPVVLSDPVAGFDVDTFEQLQAAEAYLLARSRVE
jgi:CTP:molybdopterin cytidylyltransferase MocA